MKKIFLFVAAICCTMAVNAKQTVVEPGTKAIETALGSAQAGDTLLLKTGEYNETTYELKFNNAITLLADEDATPVVKLYEAKIYADFAAEGITFKQVGDGNRIIRTGTSGMNISFKNCSFDYGVGTSQMIYLSSNTVSSLTFDGCLFTGASTASQFILQAQGATITNFTLTNSTVMNAGGTDATQAFICEHIGAALVDHCTFYNCGDQIVYLKGTACQVKNCIFVSPTENSDNCIKTYMGTVDNCLHYNLAAPRGGDATVNGSINANPLFVDADNGDFKLKVGSPAIAAGTDGKNIGDLRWGNETSPGTGLNVVKAVKAQKVMKNGAVVIERNGVRYNVLGAQF